jgi:predicted dehydrogenase
MERPFRVGVVGANPERGWALAAHLPALEAMADFEIAAVCTTRQETADETARRFQRPSSLRRLAGDAGRRPDRHRVGVREGGASP